MNHTPFGLTILLLVCINCINCNSSSTDPVNTNDTTSPPDAGSDAGFRGSVDSSRLGRVCGADLSCGDDESCVSFRYFDDLNFREPRCMPIGKYCDVVTCPSGQSCSGQTSFPLNAVCSDAREVPKKP